MVNTWKNIHKNNTFGNDYKQYKKDLKNNHYDFSFIENYKNWKIYYDKHHKIYGVSLGNFGLSRHYKTKKTAKQFIINHLNYTIEDLKNNDLD